MSVEAERARYREDLAKEVKKHHDELESERTRHHNELESERRRHHEEIESERTRQHGEIESERVRHQTDVESRKREIEALWEGRVEDQARLRQDSLNRVADFLKQITDSWAGGEQEAERQDQTGQRESAATQNSFETWVSTLEASYKQEITRLQARYEADISALHNNIHAREEATKNQDNLHAERLASLTREKHSELSAQAQHHDVALATQKRIAADALKDLESRWKREISRVKEMNSLLVHSLEERLSTQAQKMRGIDADARKEIAAIQLEMNQREKEMMRREEKALRTESDLRDTLKQARESWAVAQGQEEKDWQLKFERYAKGHQHAQDAADEMRAAVEKAILVAHAKELDDLRKQTNERVTAMEQQITAEQEESRKQVEKARKEAHGELERTRSAYSGREQKAEEQLEIVRKRVEETKNAMNRALKEQEEKHLREMRRRAEAYERLEGKIRLESRGSSAGDEDIESDS